MKIIIMFFLLIHSSLVFSLENLQKGVGITEENGSALRSTSIPYAIARQGQRAADNNELVEAYLEVTDSVYSLSSKPDLIQAKKADRTLLGNWPLTPYGEHLFLSGESVAAYEAIAAVHGRDTDLPADKMTIVDYEASYMLDRKTDAYNHPGCLQQTPLRYGDIDADGNNEIVLFLGTDIVVFSPTQKKVIFSSHYSLRDELMIDEVGRFFPGTLKASDPQYVASSGTDVLVQEIYPAQRSFSKLYFGEFSNDTKPDIIIWRKLYQSRIRSNIAPGFDKIGDKLVHYSLENGRYQLEQTPDVTIKQWLADKALTWSKGYPNLSECPGQENQLIPEMHDALLNDPEVLQ